MGPPTDPRPLGSARGSKWSVRPWFQYRSVQKKNAASTSIFSLLELTALL
ncbi:unnamed protein product [Staurois parvus]|uniref:Prepilin-type N-terminal cleavage/methylation domain-containing protein n=1 Tax=Staurois parvus TaxID=386267 RepID=A0ABN9BRC6_9NEOB|nr:unnamed protein product [Staurois parvus]